jgi:hypothetical protein
MTTVRANIKKTNFLNIHERSSNEKQRVLSVRGGSTLLSESERSNTSPLFSLGQNFSEDSQDELHVKKRDGSVELLSEEKVRRKLLVQLEVRNSFIRMKRSE